jgi:hypothetical protein
MTIYASHKYPCIDIYPQGKGFVTNQQLLHQASSLITADLQSSKLGAGNIVNNLKAAFKISAVWNVANATASNPFIIKIAFLDGTPQQQQFVQKTITDGLQPLVPKLKFVWGVPVEQSMMRISFALRGQAWSAIGNECLSVPIPQPTMNLGWLDDDTDFDAPQYKGTGQVVLHEFGHAMGMIHEHQNPVNNPINWNTQAVYTALGGPPNNWSKEQIDQNMFMKYGSATLCPTAKTALEKQNYCQGEMTNGSTYDSTSIMEYLFPASWTMGGNPIPVNTTYSKLDKEWLIKYYGFPTTSNAPLISLPLAWYVWVMMILAVLAVIGLLAYSQSE